MSNFGILWKGEVEIEDEMVKDYDNVNTLNPAAPCTAMR